MRKATMIGIVLFLFLNTAEAAFWSDWLSQKQFQTSFDLQVKILKEERQDLRNKESDFERAKKELTRAKRSVAIQETQKFNAHCQLYSSKLGNDETPQDARIEPACLHVDSKEGQEMYYKILEGEVTTVSQ
jgi:hypothetical protein